MTRTRLYSVLSALLTLLFLPVHAQEDTLTVFTEKNPLVYEDAWDLWPYSFLDDKGEPDGYNIDLIRMLMRELHIPYIIKLKPQQEAFMDLKEGRSDLTLGLAEGFHDAYGLYGKNALTLFTQSVVTPKDKPIEIRTFRDLGKDGLKVIVNDSSLCHHLMIDYGWAEHAVPSKDIREAIQQVSAKDEGQIVWNTLSLKWLMNRYHIDNLELTPVNMPHGEYKFMANSQQLLDRLDDAYTRLYTADKVHPLQDKWFYPERQKPGIPQWIWYVLTGALLLLLAMSVYGISYRMQSRRLQRANAKRNRRLGLIMETSHVRIWTYDISSNQFAWRNNNGQVAYNYTMEEFSERYSPEDFTRLKDALDHLAGDTGKPDEEITLELKARDTESGDDELRDFMIVLSVFGRDKNGKPTTIIGTKKDVTEEREQQRLDNERTLRYWSIFYTPIIGIMLFDKQGKLVNINPKACELYHCDPDDIISEGVTLNDIFATGEENLQALDGFHATQFVTLNRIPEAKRKVKSIHYQGNIYYEYQLMTVDEDSGELLGVFAFCRDMTGSVNGLEQLEQAKAELKDAKRILARYDESIDNVLHESDVRLVTYSPKSHQLTIHRSSYEVQHTLTQTRCMTLVDERSAKLAMHTLNAMDEREDKTIKANIRTTLRVKGRRQLTLQFCLMPQTDKHGEVTEYLGLLRDISELREVERLMMLQTAKVQEVENTKNKFVKNMVQDLRKPMDTVVEYVGLLGEKAPAENEAELCTGIQKNADSLLHLIDNVLYLSRLEAKMVEIVPQPRDFAEVFESQCRTGWARYMNTETRYVVESPYEQLIVDIDSENLAHAIEQVCANAAQHTKSGTVKARYDYIGRRLIISIDDTGEGIPQAELERLNRMEPEGSQSTKGLGLSITKELIHQMGGTVEINSEIGSGTTVYITLPCHASSIKRKKNA